MKQVFTKPIFILGVLCVLSVIVRWPNLIHRPLSNLHGEDALSHVLVTMRAYDETPASIHYFRPIFTLGADYNKFIDNLPTASYMDDKGNNYYISFPPLFFVLPYAVFKVFQIPIEVVPLRLFNVTIGLLVTVLLYCFLRSFLRWIFPRRSIGKIEGAALASASLYLFAASSLWGHGNPYWGHQLNQLWWLCALFIFFKDVSKEEKGSSLTVVLIILSLLMCWTEWTGFLFTGSLIAGYAYLHFSKRTAQGLWKGAALTGTAFAAAISIVAFQSYQFGLDEYFSAILGRIEFRSGGVGLIHLHYMLLTFVWCLLPALVIVALAAACSRQKLRRLRLRERRFSRLDLMAFLFVLFAPSVENLLLPKHTILYDYAVLKVLLAICVVAGLMIIYLNQNRTLVVMMIAYTAANMAVYYHLNPVEFDHIYYNGVEKAGLLIREETTDKQLAFANTFIRGEVIHPANRNIFESINVEQAQEILTARGYEEGVYFWFAPIRKLEGGGPYRHIDYKKWDHISAILWLRQGDDRPVKLRVFPQQISLKDTRLNEDEHVLVQLTEVSPMRFTRRNEIWTDNHGRKLLAEAAGDPWIRLRILSSSENDSTPVEYIETSFKRQQELE